MDTQQLAYLALQLRAAAEAYEGLRFQEGDVPITVVCSARTASIPVSALRALFDARRAELEEAIRAEIAR